MDTPIICFVYGWEDDLDVDKEKLADCFGERPLGWPETLWRPSHVVSGRLLLYLWPFYWLWHKLERLCVHNIVPASFPWWNVARKNWQLSRKTCLTGLKYCEYTWFWSQFQVYRYSLTPHCDSYPFSVAQFTRFPTLNYNTTTNYTLCRHHYMCIDRWFALVLFHNVRFANICGSEHGLMNNTWVALHGPTGLIAWPLNIENMTQKFVFTAPHDPCYLLFAPLSYDQHLKLCSALEGCPAYYQMCTAWRLWISQWWTLTRTPRCVRVIYSVVNFQVKECTSLVIRR